MQSRAHAVTGYNAVTGSCNDQQKRQVYIHIMYVYTEKWKKKSYSTRIWQWVNEYQWGKNQDFLHDNTLKSFKNVM